MWDKITQDSSQSIYWGNFIKKAVTHTILIAGALFILIPIIWALTTSFKTMEEVFRYPPQLIPENFNLSSYIDAWNAAPFGRYLVNSTIVSSVITLAQLITCSLAAYTFARFKYLGRDLLFIIYLGTMMMPQQVMMIPNFLLLHRLGLIDTYPALTLPFLAHPFGVFLLRQYFKGIPDELEDAAKLDGCSRLRFLIKIVIPMSRSAMAALALFTFMTSWNYYMWPLIVTNTETMRTITIGLAAFRTEAITLWPQLMAGTMIATIPILILYFFAQEQFVKGIKMSGVKG